MKICSLLLLAAATAVVLAHSAVAAEPKVIAPENARQNVGELCTATFKVRHAKHGVNRKTYFLDSREDFKSPENLGVQIGEAMASRLKEKKSISDPHVFYADKTIRVTGKIFLQEDRAYLTIEDVEHIQLVDDAK